MGPACCSLEADTRIRVAAGSIVHMSMTSECRVALRNLRQGGWLLAVVVVMLAVAIGGQTAPPTGARGSEEQSCVVIQELAARIIHARPGMRKRGCLPLRRSRCLMRSWRSKPAS